MVRIASVKEYSRSKRREGGFAIQQVSHSVSRGWNLPSHAFSEKACCAPTRVGPILTIIISSLMVTFILNLANSSKISPSKLLFIPIFAGVICITTSASFTITDDIALHLLYLPVLYCT